MELIFIIAVEPKRSSCLPAVEEHLKKFSELQEEWKVCLQRSQESMKVIATYLRLEPCSKLDDQWLGPFPISKACNPLWDSPG
ncbi:uncharacterized protein VP01_7299g1, partial [Puccinia sorghi]